MFADENRRLASESLAKYRLSEQSLDASYLVAGATNVLHVGERVVFAYVYTNYESEDDRVWVRQTFRWLVREHSHPEPRRHRARGAHSEDRLGSVG